MPVKGCISVTAVVCVLLVALQSLPPAAALTNNELQHSEAVSSQAAGPEESRSRARRFVPFPTGSKVVAEFTLSLPTGATTGLSNVGLSNKLTIKLPDSTIAFARNYEQVAADRLYLYNNVESFLASLGYDGHACTLRTVCEVAESPFEHDLYGDLINLMLSTSHGADVGKDYDEYQLAEYYGKTYGDCGEIYPACPVSVLDTVSTAF